MKRDMDLIRNILLFAEENCDGYSYIGLYDSDLFQSHDRITIDGHIDLATKRGFIDANHASNGWAIRGLTWDGHEFLDNSRTPEVWNAAKESAGHLSFGVFGAVLNHLAINHGLSLLKSGFNAAVSAATGS